MDKEFSEFYIGTAADVSSAGVKILFDGQAAATEKRYKILNTGVQVAADDRVIVAKISGSYVVLGKISYTQSGGGGGGSDYVLKAGDSMTGDLDFTLGKSPLLDAYSLIVGTRPSSNIFANPVSFRDKLQTLYAKLQGIFLSDGRVGTQLLATRSVSGTNYENRIGLYLDESGNSSVGITAPKAWLEALEPPTVVTPTIPATLPSGVTSIGYIHVTQSGYVVEVDGNITRDTVDNGSNWLNIASGLPLPLIQNSTNKYWVIPTAGTLASSARSLYLRISPTGNLAFAYGQAASSTSLYRFTLTYIAADLNSI